LPPLVKGEDSFAMKPTNNCEPSFSSVTIVNMASFRGSCTASRLLLSCAKTRPIALRTRTNAEIQHWRGLSNDAQMKASMLPGAIREYFQLTYITASLCAFAASRPYSIRNNRKGSPSNNPRSSNYLIWKCFAGETTTKAFYQPYSFRKLYFASCP
jgi:hypothetical protein